MAVPWFRHRQPVQSASQLHMDQLVHHRFPTHNPDAGPRFNVARCNAPACRTGTTSNTSNPAASSSCVNVELVTEPTTSGNACTTGQPPIAPSNGSTAPATTTQQPPPTYNQGYGTPTNRLPTAPSRTAPAVDRTISAGDSTGTSTTDNKWELVAFL